MSQCKSCKSKIIWVKTNGGKRMPVDWREDLEGDKIFDPKRHISHFSSCIDADNWRKNKNV